MGSLRSLWNPFSRKGKNFRAEAKENKEEAKKMLEASREARAEYERKYKEQKALSEKLREEQRKNHFAEMFQEAVPLREN